MNINFKLRYKIRQVLSYFLSVLILIVGFPVNSKVCADEINLDSKSWIDDSDTDNGNSGSAGCEEKYVGPSNDIKNSQYGILVDKSSWGKEVNNNGVINYVDDVGKTSAEVDKEDIIWLKEESIDHYDSVTGEPVITSSWYGLDNSKATFKRGSRFWVHWLSEYTNKEEYIKYYEQLDDKWKETLKKGKRWIFLTGVTDPYGNEYTNIGQEIYYNIQVSDDWDKDSLAAVYITTAKDEEIASPFVNMSFPAGNSEFARLKLKHFSPYLIGEANKTNKSTSTGIINKKINFNDYETSDNDDIIATNLIMLYSALVLASWIFRKQT